jgi:hypothetical protein
MKILLTDGRTVDIVIPAKVRQTAGVIALDAFPSERVGWTDVAHIRKLRAHVRNAYLQGWLDATCAALGHEPSADQTDDVP